MERPNTVAGLKAKRDQLVAIRSDLDAQARKITCDIDHLDADGRSAQRSVRDRRRPPSLRSANTALGFAESGRQAGLKGMFEGSASVAERNVNLRGGRPPSALLEVDRT
jgi:hypothetical protein